MPGRNQDSRTAADTVETTKTQDPQTETQTAETAKVGLTKVQAAALLAAVGGDPDAHHAKVRKAAAEQDLDLSSKEALASAREDLRKAAATPEPTEEDLAKLLEDLQNRYPHVVALSEVSPSGKATRCVVACKTPGCSGTREVAVQDAFQVDVCDACLAKRRREAAKARRARRKARLAEGS